MTEFKTEIHVEKERIDKGKEWETRTGRKMTRTIRAVFGWKDLLAFTI